MSLAPGTALRLVEVLASVGVVLSSLEYLSRPHTANDASLASWQVLRLRYRRYFAGVTGSALGLVLAFPQVLWVLAVRAVAAACLIPVALDGAVHVVLLGVVAASSIALSLRGSYGGEGSDQILKMVFCALLLVAACPTTTAMRLGLWFLAAQVCLAYFVSGIYKVTSPVWLDGTGLSGVLSTRCYGNPHLATWLAAHPVIAKWASRAVSLLETLFPLVLVAPASWLPYFLAMGAGFHASCAVIMGLDCFLWAFTAGYPAVAYVVLQ